MARKREPVEKKPEDLVERILTHEEIMAMEHPKMIDPNDIVSGRKVGQTTIFVLNTAYKDITPEENLRRKKRLAEVAWGIVDNMRARGVDI